MIGSTDNTKEIVNNFIRENKIRIRYFYQQNGGKHRALNNGISNIESKMTFIVDSDDYLEDNAINIIESYYNKYKNDNTLAGFSFLRCFPNKKINGPKFKEDEYRSDYIKCRLNENIWGDKAEVYYTECLKEFPFLEIPGEKFLVESYVWAQIALKYDMIHINKAIYIGDYNEDGLTTSMNKRKYESPIGFAEKSKVLFYNSKSNLKIKCKSMILYIAYSKIANRSYNIKKWKIYYKILFFVMFPLGVIQKYRIEKSIRKGDFCGKKAES